MYEPAQAGTGIGIKKGLKASNFWLAPEEKGPMLNEQVARINPGSVGYLPLN